MRNRAPRRKVFVQARIRHGAHWDDVRVLDVSSGGFLLQVKKVPPRGTYIELCRGRANFVARVVWTGQEHFGVSTRDEVPVSNFVEAGATAQQPEGPRTECEERPHRTGRREATLQLLERNRWRARTIEYASLIGGGAFVALLLIGLLQDALMRPLSMIANALTPN